MGNVKTIFYIQYKWIVCFNLIMQRAVNRCMVGQSIGLYFFHFLLVVEIKWESQLSL